MTQTTLITLALYLGIGGAYLVVLPFILYLYLQKRWNYASSIERTLAYFFVFLLFPGLLLLGPFLNFRPKLRKIEV